MSYVPDSAYVSSRLLQLQRELEGFHRKIAEIEALRYGEDASTLKSSERPSGIEVHTLMLADMVESVKAAITANLPKATYKPLRSGDAAKTNSSKREQFANLHMKKIRQVIIEWVDAQVGLGFGILKGGLQPWPTAPRRKKTKETDREYLRRVRDMKRKWGLPYFAVSPHPMTYYWSLGVGNKIVESIEHSWRPKAEVYAKYSLSRDSDIEKRARGSAMLDESLDKQVQEARARLYGAISGQPEELVRPLPYGADTSTMCMVDEYWSDSCYQVYVNRHLIYEEEGEPTIGYFPAIGRSSSSKDPDKIGLSVAEALRVNEPIINRALTRMAEGAEMLVRKPLVIEQEMGSSEGVVLGATNDPTKNTIKFDLGAATVLTPGKTVKSPFDGVENIYGAMPFLELMLRLTGQHGVAPIFKGMPPGAAGSGYRDNSLYLMAKAQFAYLVDSIEVALAEYLMWLEEQIVKYDQTVYLDELEMKPKDIGDFPCVVEVSLDPALPQNLIAEANLYMDAHERGYGPRRWVYEKGFKEEQSEELDRERMLEDVQEMLKQGVLYQDVLTSLGMMGGAPQDAGSGLVDQYGNPLAPSQPGGPGGVQQLLGPGGASPAPQLTPPGAMRAGVPREPPYRPGTFPPQ